MRSSEEIWQFIQLSAEDHAVTLRTPEFLKTSMRLSAYCDKHSLELSPSAKQILNGQAWCNPCSLEARSVKTRRWTDDDLCEAAKSSYSWAELKRKLGYSDSSNKHVLDRLRLRALELNLDTSHLMHHGKYSVCAVDDCVSAYYARRYCKTHYQSLFATIEKRWNRESDRSITEDGYVLLFKTSDPLVQSASGRILEHRYVMAQLLGRPLLPTEQVHHLNANRQDNSPENLELWLTGQPAGARVSDQIAWAKKILKLYEPSVLRSDDATE